MYKDIWRKGWKIFGKMREVPQKKKSSPLNQQEKTIVMKNGGAGI